MDGYGWSWLRCSDESIHCLSPRGTAVLISIISLIGCVVDVLFNETKLKSNVMLQHVETLRHVVITLFQIANMFLLLGSIIENVLLLKLYLWYMLSFVIISLVISILDLCFHFKDKDIWSFVTFVVDVTFLFVTFRCLPFVDNYKKGLEGLLM